MTVSLQILNGQVTSVKVLKYTGTGHGSETIGKLFRKLNLPGYSGTIELELKLI